MKYTTIILLVCAAIVMSCSSSRPSYVLSSGDMEDILYDLHRAQAVGMNMDYDTTSGARQYAMFLSVLKKHDVSVANWDSSMVYYTRNADELAEIYNNLSERLDYEASTVGASVSDGIDSTDIWKAERHVLLFSNDPYESQTWELKADTLLKPGDKLTLQFTGIFLNTQVQQRATAVIAIRLKNDSVIVRNLMMSSSSTFTCNISDDKKLGIKSVTGLFMLNKPSTLQMGDEVTTNNTAQVLCITGIHLLHEAAPEEKPVGTQQAGGTDSLRQAHPDSVLPPPPHPNVPVSGPTSSRPNLPPPANPNLPTPKLR